MSFHMEKKLPTPKEIKEMYPVSEALAKCKEEKDQEPAGCDQREERPVYRDHRPLFRR